MSWDEMSRSKHECPCGKGSYTVKYFMDDWNRSSETWTMSCPICKKKYRMHSFESLDSGLTNESRCWITKESYESFQKSDKELTRLADSIVKLAESKYSSTWLSHFNGKGKKLVWIILTNNGKKDPSLSTFYNRVKAHGVQEYLRNYITIDNLNYVLKILKVIDKEVTAKLLEYDKKKKQFEKIKRTMLKNSFT